MPPRICFSRENLPQALRYLDSTVVKSDFSVNLIYGRRKQADDGRRLEDISDGLITALKQYKLAEARDYVGRMKSMLDSVSECVLLESSVQEY